MTPDELQSIAYRTERALSAETGQVVIVAIIQGNDVVWSVTAEPEKVRQAISIIQKQLQEGDYRQDAPSVIVSPWVQ